MTSRRIIKYFNIHNLVKIKIETDFKHKLDSIRFQLREFEIFSLPDQEVDIFIHDYSVCPVLNHPVVLSEYYFYSRNYLNIPSQNLCFNFIDHPIKMYCDLFLIPIGLLVELILLKQNRSLLHSAAVQYKTKNYLLPSFGGVGKTTAISAVLSKGGKLYGDDMVIINQDEILSYPLDFTIYPYHLKTLNIKDKSMIYHFNKTKILNKITNKLKNYNLKPVKLVILILDRLKIPYFNVPPKLIYGENCIVKKGSIDEVFFLSKMKNNLPEITIHPIDSHNLAEICTNILLQEWHGAMSIIYTYCGLSSFSLNLLFAKIREIYTRTFINRKCFQVTIPYDLDNLNYQKQLISCFERK